MSVLRTPVPLRSLALACKKLNAGFHRVIPKRSEGSPAVSWLSIKRWVGLAAYHPPLWDPSLSLGMTPPRRWFSYLWFSASAVPSFRMTRILNPGKFRQTHFTTIFTPLVPRAMLSTTPERSLSCFVSGSPSESIRASSLTFGGSGCPIIELALLSSK